MKGILGYKLGMTQVFTKSGKLIPVTVIQAEPNIVTQIKTAASDKYDAVQLGFANKREKLSNKPEIEHLKKANTTPKRFLKEIRGINSADYKLGQEIKVDIFNIGELVDVTGISKGKGFQGVIKRHNQSRGPMGHGSQYHRGVGSLGPMSPMRVLKGKKLPGQMGHETVTIQSLEVIDIDITKNIILIKGSVPGPRKSLVIIKTAVKNPDVKRESEELNYYENSNIEVKTDAVSETIVNENNTIEEKTVNNDETASNEEKEVISSEEK
jgi:large subunit ribosomal protein L3